MASPNGNSLSGATTRKRLVQPVLPALPLLSKSKRGVGKVKEQSQAVADGAREQPQAVEEPYAGTLPTTAVVGNTSSVEQNSTSADQTNDFSPPVELTSGMVQAASPDHDDIAQTFNQGPAHITTSDSRNGHTYDAVNSIIAPLSVSNDEHITSESNLALRPDGVENTHTKEQTNGDSHGSNQELTTEPSAPPEVATGLGDIAVVPPRSDNHSISTASIDLTSRHQDMAAAPKDVENPSEHLKDPSGDSSVMPGKTSNGLVKPEQTRPGPNGLVAPLSKPQGFVPILEHISKVHHAQEWSDCDINLYSPGSTTLSMRRNAHSLFLLRSDKLRNMLYPQKAQSYFYFVINLFPARAIAPNAFNAALAFLYNDTIVSTDQFLLSNNLTDNAGRRQALDYVFSYMSAGLELGIHPVVGQAFKLLGNVLDWDVAELVVREALALRAMSPGSPHSSSEGRIAADSILQCVFDLFLTRLDLKQFQLDTITSGSDMPSRLAQFEPGRPAVNPALARMVFGSMPASADASPTLSDQIPSPTTWPPNAPASVIMLNLEFEDLFVFNQTLMSTYGAEWARIMREVVEERERRRLNVLDNKSVSNKQRNTNQATWEIVGWREYMFNDSLHRDRTGFLLGPKRG